jgi:hypothetical protein
MKILYSIFFLVIGIVSVLLFELDMFLPVWASVAIFFGVSLFLWFRFKNKCVGVLVLLLWVAYALPFIHIVPYLWFDFANDDPLAFWAFTINPYMLEKRVIELTSMIGAVGGIGFALGVSMHRKGIVQPSRIYAINSIEGRRSLVLPMFVVWVLAGLFLSWLSAPEATLFAAAYTNSALMLF